MSQNKIEHLLQITAGAIRASGTGTRPGERRADFDDHFHLASIASPHESDKAPYRLEIARAPKWTSGPATSDVSLAPTQNDLGDRTQTQDRSHNRPAEASNESNQADENSDVHRNPVADANADATDTAASEDESATNDEHSNEPDDEAAQEAPATAAGVVSDGTLLTETVLALATTEETALAVTAATGATSSHEPDGETTTTNERVRPAAKQVDLQLFERQRTDSATQTVGADETADAGTLTIGKSAGEEITTHPAARNGKGKKVEAHGTARRAAASDLPAAEEANDSTVAVSRPAGESTDQSPADDSNTRADEPQRRATSRATSKFQAAPNNVAGANVADVTSSKSGETAENAGGTKDSTGHSIKPSAPKTDALANMLGRPHSGSSAAHRVGRTAGEEDLPRVDAARFLGRVTKAFHTAHERGGTLHLRLSPPELGSLRLELTVKEGVMIATLETETPAARRVLLDHLPALRDRLAEQNIRVERFDVDVRRDGGGQTDGRAEQQQNDRQPDQPPPRRPPATPSNVAEPTTRDAPAPQPSTSNAQINLVA